MAGTQQHAPTSDTIVNSRGKHIHHGRTTAAWVGTIVASVAFVLGGIALVIPNWPLFWVSVALLVVAVIAAKVLQVMGYGAH